MPNITVTCRCTRSMRQEVGRRAGYLACTCGNRVRLDDTRRTICIVPERNGDPCGRRLTMTDPIALCSVHVLELARTGTFLREGVDDQQRQEWKRREEGETADKQRARRIKETRWAMQEKLRQEQLEAQAVVYYIARGDLIKIGFTTNMKERMGSLMPDAVLATEPGTRSLEKKRHRQFAHARGPIGREYFTRHPALLLYIETVLAEHGEPANIGYPKYDTWHIGGRMLVPVKEASKLFDVSVRALYEWIRDERLTVVRPAGRKRGALLNAYEVEELAGLRKDGRLPRIDRVG